MPIDPADVLVGIHPRRRLVAKHQPRRARARIAAKQVVTVLQAVQLLDRERVLVDPRQAGDVVLAWIAGHLHPRGGAAVGIDHTDAHRAVARPCLRVRNARERRVQRIGGVDQRERLDAGAVELPVGDGAAVRTPAERIADAEFLLVHPIGRAVDRRLAAVSGQPRDPAIVEALDEDVVGAHVRDARRIGRELRKQQRRLRTRRRQACGGARLSSG